MSSLGTSLSSPSVKHGHQKLTTWHTLKEQSATILTPVSFHKIVIENFKLSDKKIAHKISVLACSVPTPHGILFPSLSFCDEGSGIRLA